MSDFYASGPSPDTSPANPSESEATTNKMRDNWQAYIRARDAGHLRYVDDASQFDRYYCGEQWDDATVAKLDAEGRPHQTINFVLSTVNTVLGEHIKRRVDTVFKPSGKGATQLVASALDEVFKQIGRNNKSKYNEQDMMADGLIQDRGYLDIGISFEDSLYGEVKEEVLDPLDVIPDPNARDADPATWSEVFLTRWLTPDEVGALYGEEHAKKLETYTVDNEYGMDALDFTTDRTFGDVINGGSWSFGESAKEQRRVRRVRVIERRYRVLTKVSHFVDPDSGDMREVPENWSNERSVEFALQMGLEISKKLIRKVRVCITAAGCLLFEGYNVFNELGIIPFFPYFRRGRPFGLVRNLVSPQDMLNKVSSQELHVVNTTANSGWTFEAGSLINMDGSDLESVGAKTGLVLEYAKGAAAPQKIQPNQVPTGLDRISDKSSMFFREISGISQTMMGQTPREISGVAINEQSSAGMTQLEVVYDNLAKARYWRAELVLKLIQQFYTEERIIQITKIGEEGDIMQEDMPVNQPTPEGTITNDLTLGEYTVVISETAAKDTENDSVFSQLLQMREAGLTIPDYAIIEASNLPNKYELSAHVKQLMGMAEPTEEEIAQQQAQAQMEMEMANATLQEITAKAQERMANAQKLMAQAQAEAGKPDMEMQKIGAQLRADMENAKLEFQKSRDDIMARMQIAQLKNENLLATESMRVMAKRMDSEMKRKTNIDAALLTRQTTLDSAMIAANAKATAETAKRREMLKKRTPPKK